MRIIIDLAFTDSPESFKDDPGYAETVRQSQQNITNQVVQEINQVLSEAVENPNNTDLVGYDIGCWKASPPVITR